MDASRAWPGCDRSSSCTQRIESLPETVPDLKSRPRRPGPPRAEAGHQLGRPLAPGGRAGSRRRFIGRSVELARLDSAGVVFQSGGVTPGVVQSGRPGDLAAFLGHADPTGHLGGRIALGQRYGPAGGSPSGDWLGSAAGGAASGRPGRQRIDPDPGWAAAARGQEIGMIACQWRST